MPGRRLPPVLLKQATQIRVMKGIAWEVEFESKDELLIFLTSDDVKAEAVVDMIKRFYTKEAEGGFVVHHVGLGAFWASARAGDCYYPDARKVNDRLEVVL